MLSRRTFLEIAGLCGLAGCTGLSCSPIEIDDLRRKLLLSWGESFLLPAYRDVEARAAELKARVETLCAAPSAQALNGAQVAWWDARGPWKQAEVFAFGPYTDEPLRLGPKVDFWPVRPDSIEEVLAGVDPLTPQSVEWLGAAAKGFPAIEYLLYQPGIDIVTELSSAPRRCEYLLALAADLITRTRELAEAWDPAHGNYLGQLVEAGRGSATYDSLQMALGEVVNRMGFTVETIRSDKLGRPAGATTGGSPQPDKAESQFSGRSVEDIQDNLRGIERLYFGNEPAGEMGLDLYLRERGKHLGAAMRTRLDASYAALDAIPVPLVQAVLEYSAEVNQANNRLFDLQRFLQVDILSALSLTVTFSGNDGD